MFPSTSLLYIFPFLILAIFIRSKWISSQTKTKKNLPPSPQKIPIIGNLHQLGMSPHRSLQALSRKDGPLMLLHFGSVPTLIASSSEAAGEIMKTHDPIFSGRSKLSVPNKVFYGSKDIAFSPYGEHWRQVKSIAVLQLLSSKRVQSFRQVREQEVVLMLDTIGKICGSPVDLSELFVSLTNNIVCRVALGRTFQGLKFKDLMGRLMSVMAVFSFTNFIPWLSWVDRLSGLKGTVDRIAKEFDVFIEGVIKEHVNKKRAMDDGGGSQEHQDFVDILLDLQTENAIGSILDRDSIKAVVLDMFIAGTDTTSTNIEWTIAELIRHPRIMKKLQQEVQEIMQGRPVITDEDLEKMKYLKAVLKETMRLHIPVPLLVPRETKQDVKLMGYGIPAGTQVMVNAWAIGRDPSLWEPSEEFRPERFLNSGFDYKGVHFELLPFGADRSGCPGIGFALAVNELAVANLVYMFDFALASGANVHDLDMSEDNGMTVRKKSPLLVVATPRS